EQLVVGGELPGHRLARRDGAAAAGNRHRSTSTRRPLRRGAVALDLPEAVLDDRERETTGLAQRVRRRVHADAIGTGLREACGDAGGAALAAVQVAVVH